MHDAIRKLIQSQDICVLATSRNNTPHASLMGYVPSEDCSTFFLATYRNTTKFANLQANPEVSLLLDDRSAHPDRNRLETAALTVHGRAEILHNAKRRTAAADLLQRNLPHLHDFLAGEEIEFIAVTATDFLLLQGPTAAVHEKASGK